MTTRVWRLIAHHKHREKAKIWYAENSRIAIGWGDIGNLSVAAVSGPKDIGLLIRSRCEEPYKSQDGGPSLWGLYARMREGDLVIVGLPQPTERFAVLRVAGGYEWRPRRDPLLGDYQHQRPAVATEFDPDELWQRVRRDAIGEGPRWTLHACAEKLDETADTRTYKRSIEE